jgi:hypothetical protein
MVLFLSDEFERPARVISERLPRKRRASEDGVVAGCASLRFLAELKSSFAPPLLLSRAERLRLFCPGTCFCGPKAPRTFESSPERRQNGPAIRRGRFVTDTVLTSPFRAGRFSDGFEKNKGFSEKRLCSVE